LRTSGNTLTDTFTYTMRDAAGLTSTTQVTITIQGANDAPHDLLGALSIAENAANGSAVGTITRSDVDSGETATYSLVDDAGGRFAINSSTGVVNVANGSLLDREAAASHNITVRVTDTAGATYDEVMTVTITDVDEFDIGAVSDTNAAANSLAENSANGTAVGITASATDADATAVITYTLDDNSGGRFAINSSTGIVTVANSSLLNYEAATSHSITVRATSSDGSWSTQAFTINLTDVNESVGPVSDVNAATNSVIENSVNGTTVGLTALAIDQDATNNTVSYSLDDSAGGRFAIDSSTGVATVANSSLLDREAAASHSIIVRATSVDGSWSTQSFTISLTDVDEFDVGAVTDGNAAANSVAENSANGT
ncbi:MAG: cadherin repeat domain-containing protein, partial [Planctomycetota bacterium]